MTELTPICSPAAQSPCWAATHAIQNLCSTGYADPGGFRSTQFDPFLTDRDWPDCWLHRQDSQDTKMAESVGGYITAFDFCGRGRF